MSRCARCNGKGYDLVTAEEAKDHDYIPEKVLKNMPNFWRCKTPACQRIYWSGEKTSDTRDLFASLFQ